MNILRFYLTTFTVNITTTKNTERRYTGINRIGLSVNLNLSEFKRFTDIYNPIRWDNYSLYKFTNAFNITTTWKDSITMYRTIAGVFTVSYSKRKNIHRKMKISDTAFLETIIVYFTHSSVIIEKEELSFFWKTKKILTSFLLFFKVDMTTVR